jgi:SAM-dependent methyltransferase
VSADRQRHARLAAALPGTPRRVADLGCGNGLTLLALRERLGPDAELIGIERHETSLPEELGAKAVVADLNKRLPFEDASLDAALCHNVVESLVSSDALLAEIARVLRPGGHFLLSSSDFDTLLFNTQDLQLTRTLVHTFADTQEPWMDRADGTMGRKLRAVAQRAPLECVDVLAWVELSLDVTEGSAAAVAIEGISAAVRRDRPDLAGRLEEWVADVQGLAGRGELVCSINDYAVLLRRPE